MAAHDIMVILDRILAVADEHSSVTAGPGKIGAMFKGDRASIRPHEAVVRPTPDRAETTRHMIAARPPTR